MERALLHLGAYKTGTTHFQECLDASPALFEQANCRLVNRYDIPEEAWLELITWQQDLEPSPPPVSYQNFLHQIREDPTPTVMLSNEGLIGRVPLSLDGGIYPSQCKGIHALRAALAGCEVRVAFTVRSYADYITSTYSEMVNGAFSTLTFDEYLQRIDLDRLSWAPVVGKLREAFGADNVKVWAYESYAHAGLTHGRRIVDYLLGAGSGQLLNDIGATRVRPSAGVNALCLQREINEAVRNVVRRKDRRRSILLPINEAVREAFGSAVDQRLSLDPTLRNELDERYQRHCLELGIEAPTGEV